MKTPHCRILLTDADPVSRKTIACTLQKAFPEIKEITETGSMAEATAAFGNSTPDIMLLDVELPDGNGFDLLKLLHDRKVQVIIVTAYDRYALEAIKASVLDYVLKPVNPEECRLAVCKALERLQEPELQKQEVAALVSKMHHHLTIRKVKVPTLQGFLLADVDTLIRCEASDNYTILFFNNDTTQTVSRTLGEYEAELRDYGFVRIHHKHLVNIRQVTEYQKGKNGGYVVMQDRKMLEVSARKKESLMHAFRNRHFD